MSKSHTRNILIAMTAIAASLAGCGGSGSGSADGTGLISLGISDDPIHDAQKVCISFNEIEFKGDGPSTVVTLDPPQQVNLLAFQGKNAAPLLINQELPAGDYHWMRLGVDAAKGGNGGVGDTGGELCDGEGSYITMNDGLVYNLFVPSGAETGLKLVRGFTVPVNGSADFTVEFDLMKSLTAPPGLSPDVILRPAMRLANNVEAGTLTGQVASDLLATEGCAPSVYVFADGVTPNAIEDGVDDPNDPVATALVNAQTTEENQAEFDYTVGYLLPGDYEAAFTCDGATFEPAEGKSATITANQITTLDF